MENSVEGSVPATLDGLAEGEPLVITREGVLPVTLTLAAPPGGVFRPPPWPRPPRRGPGRGRAAPVAPPPPPPARSPRRVAELLPGVTPLPTTSTAAAARAVGEGEFDAAVCAPIAAERYGL